MNKKLVYSFYASENTIGDEVNRIHIACLKKYIDIFDSVIFTIIKDKNCKDETVANIEREILSIRGIRPISFNIIPNNEFRESKVFYDEIATRLGEDDLVFFAHNKGVSNVEKFDREVIYKWITAMYFYCLNFMDEVNDYLVNNKFYSYGAFLTHNEEEEKCNKYGWYYIGTFFWVNSKKIYNFIKNQNIELPKLCDRFYDEEFLGNIYESWPLLFTASHENRYLKNCKNYYRNADIYLSCLYEDISDFNEFYNEIIK